MPLAPGDVIAGYTVLRQLGSGGMGAVYLVRHPRLPRFDALKLLKAGALGRPRLRRAGSCTRPTSSPACPTATSSRCSTAARTRGQLWLTMQYVDGIDVEQRPGRNPRGAARPSGWRTSSPRRPPALDCAHRNNLIHRDVKPANILLAASAESDDGPEQVFLTDFGIAKSLDGATKLTRTGSVLATLRLRLTRADRVRAGGRAGPTSTRSAACSTGCSPAPSPFPGATVAALMHGHLTLPPPRPTALVPGLAPAIDDVVARAMAKDPAERYPTCRALAEAAGRALAPAPEPSTVPLAGSADRRQTDRLVAQPRTGQPPLRRSRDRPPGPAPEPSRPYRAARAGPGGSWPRPPWPWSPPPRSRCGCSIASRGRAAARPTPRARPRRPLPALPAAAALSETTLVAPRTADGNTDLFLVDVDSGGTVGRVTTAPAQDVAPLLSPDRRTIAYVQLAGDGTGVLRVVATDGTGDRPMFETTPAGCDSVLRPAWNPADPNQLAVVCIDGAGTFRLRILGIDGVVVRDLDVGFDRFDDVSFSPDGSTLVYWASDGSPAPACSPGRGRQRHTGAADRRAARSTTGTRCGRRTGSRSRSAGSSGTRSTST